MQVKLNSDDKVHGGESLAAWVQKETLDKLGRFAEQVTRVDVHLGDASTVHGQVVDKRCTLEARLVGRAPLAVSHDAAKVAEAMHGALDKLVRKVDSALGRSRDPHARESIRGGEA
jgi:ribosome-associated translation inhibitor RaiA